MRDARIKHACKVNQSVEINYEIETREFVLTYSPKNGAQKITRSTSYDYLMGEIIASKLKQEKQAK